MSLFIKNANRIGKKKIERMRKEKGHQCLRKKRKIRKNDKGEGTSMDVY
jgi:hypothetical protein